MSSQTVLAARSESPHAVSRGRAQSERSRFLTLALGSVGVVFGDIGTSPLYAFREALGQSARHGVQADAVFGVLSLALWALMLVVTVKYVAFVMRAHNKGEGGVLSLMALAQHALGGRTTGVLFLGVCGAALFYGDALITPAISVLSAVEGLRSVPVIGTHISIAVVLVSSLVILTGLFLAQSKGTSKVAALFGPVCLVWFAAIAALGLWRLVGEPQVLAALSPTYAVSFLATHGLVGAFVVGSVFLTVTGAEALYADMGHFGAGPIRAAWLVLVLPCLAINYLGQGALALHELAEAQAAGHVLANQDWFFTMAPAALRAPMVVLATLATIIASQAVITGSYSLTNQAIQLGLVPRMHVARTSESEAGQIFMPQVNLMLLIGVVLLVAIFKTSSNLAQAYGLAVSGTMAITTALAFIVARRLWRWPLPLCLAVVAPLFAIDLVFVGANLLKILSGGFVPLLLGAAIVGVIATWVRGTHILAEKTRRDSVPMGDFLARLSARPPQRVAGTAVYLVADPEAAPGTLLHNLKHNHVLHDHNLIVTVRTEDQPYVEAAERVRIDPVNADFTRVTLTYGFMQTPNVPSALRQARRLGLPFDTMSTSYFLGRRTVVPASHSGMPKWQDRLFIALAKNAATPTDYFQLPPGRVVEMGTQVSV